jgi:hypothetical protein
LVSLAGAVSSIPVIQTLNLYARLTTHSGNQEGRGNVPTQILLATEYYYVFSCLVAFLAEAFYRGPNMDDHYWTEELVDSMRHHQDIGVDDWTRLLVHSIFLNLVDEMTHLSTATSSSDHDNAFHSTTTEPSPFTAEDVPYEQDEEQVQLVVTKQAPSSTGSMTRNRR